ncbi:hypothetical protein EC991_009108 [Linnemannia zychae]|nr:hypothetical protein EC991_009108 [Linnemannia zychae]
MAIPQGNNNGAQAAANEAAVFEAERSRLITNIQIEMSQVLSNVTILNRNLETIVTIGQEFGQLSQLWKHFHASAFQLAEEERFEREAALWDSTGTQGSEGGGEEGGKENGDGGEGEGEGEEGGEYMDERYVGVDEEEEELERHHRHREDNRDQGQEEL